MDPTTNSREFLGEINEDLTMQLGFTFRTHGGKRRGAGRPTDRVRPSEPHKKRCKVTANDPVHVVMRVHAGVSRLRSKAGYAAIREACAAMMLVESERTDPEKRFRIVHLSVQHNHVHAIVEAYDQYALARGMQSFQSSAAKRLKRALHVTSSAVFADRYFAVPLRSPRQVRNTLAYVLNNWRHHHEDRGHQAWRVDPYSTAWLFDGWRDRTGTPFTFTVPRGYHPLDVWLPQTWLLRVGWKLHAPLVTLHEVPGGHE